MTTTHVNLTPSEYTDHKPYRNSKQMQRRLYIFTIAKGRLQINYNENTGCVMPRSGGSSFQFKVVYQIRPVRPAELQQQANAALCRDSSINEDQYRDQGCTKIMIDPRFLG